MQEFDLIRKWAKDIGITCPENGSTIKDQTLKLVEEVGELAQAIASNNISEFVDAIGDCVVVLTNLATLHGQKIETCILSAYNEIKDRKGKMINGFLVKNEEIN